MIFALIPAAGKSERMGRPKLSLPFAGSTVLQTVIQTIRGAGIERTLVIVGPHVSELSPLAEAAGAFVLSLKEETMEMQSTVEHGLRWAEEHFQPQPDDCWLLIPADHPTLDAKVVQLLIRARQDHSEYSIFVPTFQGKRGHPTLIDWKHTQAICALPAGKGLNQYLRQHGKEMMELPVDSEKILSDLDTPEDYASLRNSR
ncbi:MAG TPA: nucleotidyltransferase family protein [Gemmataceae bacterium]|jgi:molybdenum cofactor cytidylyltransferase